MRVTADAAYDTVAVYETATARGATVVIPPAKPATVSGHGRCGWRWRICRTVRATVLRAPEPNSERARHRRVRRRTVRAVLRDDGTAESGPGALFPVADLLGISQGRIRDDARPRHPGAVGDTHPSERRTET